MPMLATIMTPEKKEAISRERKRIANFITAHSARFYVCEGCESILDSAAPINFCPKCAGYHFSYDRQRLLDLVAVLADTLPEELAREYED